MKSKAQLLGSVLKGQTPPRALLWAASGMLHRVLKTGDRRSEFERLYLEDPDPWAFHTSAYENRKYRHVLDTALAWRRGADSALEIGCSIGVFSKALSAHFVHVTGTDIAGEALRLAARNTQGLTNLRYVRGTLETLALGERYDAVFCAEILYYIAKELAPTVCLKLDEHLSPRGIVITVSHVPDGRAETYTVEDWDTILSAHFQRLFLEDVPDAHRPYRIVVYARKA